MFEWQFKTGFTVLLLSIYAIQKGVTEDSYLYKNELAKKIDLCKSPSYIFFFNLKIFMKYISLYE